jgi:hypothetical protein
MMITADQQVSNVCAPVAYQTSNRDFLGALYATA